MLVKAGAQVSLFTLEGEAEWYHEGDFHFPVLSAEREKLQGTLDIIEKVCKSRKQMAASPTPMGGASNVYTSFPMEVTVGGATVFVLTVDQFMKL